MSNKIGVYKMINQCYGGHIMIHSVLLIILIGLTILAVPCHQFELLDNKDNCKLISKETIGQHIHVRCICTYDSVANISVHRFSQDVNVNVSCIDMNPMVYDILDKLNFIENSAVSLINCSLPVNHSFGQIFPQLTALTFLNDKYNSTGPFQRTHFGKCNKLSILIIMTNTTHALANDTFDEMRNLQTVGIGYNIKNLDALVKHRKIYFLLLTGKQFERLTKRLLQSVSQIKELRLVFDDILNIDADAFVHLTNLNRILIRSNGRMAALPKGLFANNSKISSFEMKCKDIDMEILPNELFAHVNQISSFTMNCNMKLVPEHLFINLVNIININLSYNKLQTLPLYLFTNIKFLSTLNLEHNLLTSLHDSLFNGLDFIKEVKLGNNKFAKIPYAITGGRIGKIDLSYNQITEIDYTDYALLQNSEQVDLSHNLIETLTTTDLPRNIEIDYKTGAKYGGNKFVLTGNPFNCGCEHIDDMIQLYNRFTSQHLPYPFIIDGLKCNTPANMRSRDVSSIHELDDLLCSYSPPSGCNATTDETHRIMILNCANANLTAVPILPTSVISLPSYRVLKIDALELYIDNNAITELPKLNTTDYEHITKIIARNNPIKQILPENIPTRLTTLDLSNNHLKIISTSTATTLNSTLSLQTILLGGNPWNCDCANLIVKVLLSVKRIYDLNDIKCENGELAMKFVGLCDADTKHTIIGLFIVLVLTTSISALIVIYYRNKETILVWLYAHNICMGCISEDNLDQDKQYDAFLSFAHQDDDFILDHLLPELESDPNPFRICVHVRDWLVGEFIHRQVTDSIENSCRTVIVLSPSYLESIWGRMEFRVAHTNAIRDGRPRLIVIMYKDVGDVNKLDPEMKAYLTTNTYLKWGDPRFFDKLRYALPHRRRTLPSNGVNWNRTFD